MKIFLTTICALAILFSFDYSNAQTAGGWSYNGTKTFTNPLGNFVGIGTNNPSTELTVQGSTNPSIYLVNPGLNNSSLQMAIATNDGAFSGIAKPGDKVIRAMCNLPNVTSNNLIFDVINFSDIKFVTDQAESVSIKSRGTVGQGYMVVGKASDFTKGFPTGYRLFVQDGIMAEKVKVAVKTTADWSDFVFDKSYKLTSLTNVEKFIQENHHLPNVPSADDVVANGVNLAEMDAKLLQKIEELTLYIIEQDKKMRELEKKFESMKK